ncbi:hypothetical protein [uncultured Sphingomonas sp.]|uniref:hypothetical protein n=1 Tax=uncultured Sphingomonas sp. TaxID=158754 RepID=UPI002638707B|nr:hypothetical protein [uncultured Sphingomonas sp.]
MEDVLTLFHDLAVREQTERRRLTERVNQLDRSARSRAGTGVGGAADEIFYSVEERDERDNINNLLAAIATNEEWCDPVYVAARDQFNERASMMIGYLANPRGDVDADPGVALTMASGHQMGRHTVDAALTLGLLILDSAEPPPAVAAKATSQTKTVKKPDPKPEDASAPGQPHDATRPQFRINADRTDPRWASFGKSFYAAVGETQSYSPLSLRVFALLSEEGATPTGTQIAHVVNVAEFASVMRNLAAAGVTNSETQLGRKVSEALDKVQNIGDDGSIEIGIDLPDLETVSDEEIVADNIRLMGPVICSAMLDELKAFQVVDKLLESAQNGTLPIGKGNAGKLLYKRWKESPNRISETERRDLYAMTMGQPGGNPAIQGNTDFNDLWLRFVSSVSQFVRQQDVDKLLRAALPSAVGAQQMRKAARDLATNLSLHGYGMTYYAALELQGEVKSMIQLLGDPEIRASYGARDMWQVIDQIATTELGGARTSTRYRTLATCGAIITAWLANNIAKIMRPTGPLIDMMDVRSPVPRTAGTKATSTPTDYDLVNACELWLADTAVSETRIDEMAQPRMSPVMTSKPVQMPAFAREFMDEIPGMEAGVGMGLGASAAPARSNGARYN